MSNKTLLERTGLSVEDIERIYEEEGSLERAAKRVGCSKPTIIKYLKHVDKDDRPWKTYQRKEAQHKVASEEWKAEVFDQVEHALLHKSLWMDMKQRKIPHAFIRGIYFEIPDFISPVIPLYTVLRDGTKTVLLHIVKERPGAESGEDEKTKEVDDQPLAFHPKDPRTVQHSSDNQADSGVREADPSDGLEGRPEDRVGEQHEGDR
jgi:hypothetical protein